MDQDKKENLLYKNQVDEDNNSDNDQSIDEGESDLDEDFDSGIKDDILRPASTRSKIVVNLREPAGTEGNKKKKQFSQNDKVIYDLDKYDKVRMQLIYPKQELYEKYKLTINELQSKQSLQPRKR